MARIRTIKPEFWTDERIGGLDPLTRLMFIGMWNLADDEGVLSANPSYIKSQLFPFDENLRIGDIKKQLDALVKARFLVPLSFEEQSYYVIRTFQTHQKISHPYPSKVPKELILQAITNHSVNIPGTFLEHSRNITAGKERKGMEWKGMEEERVRETFPPSLEEVEKHFREKNFPSSQAVIFWNYYESNGWRVGKNPMKKWHSAASGWISKAGDFAIKKITPNPALSCTEGSHRYDGMMKEYEEQERKIAEREKLKTMNGGASAVSNL